MQFQEISQEHQRLVRFFLVGFWFNAPQVWYPKMVWPSIGGFCKARRGNVSMFETLDDFRKFTLPKFNMEPENGTLE